jgi:hypothetical protein
MDQGSKTMKVSKFVPAKAFLIGLAPAERAKAKAKAKAKSIIADELTLVELRRRRELTQAKIGARLRINQDQVSRLERRADKLLSTLRKYFAAMGGSVHVIVDVPGKPPVRLADLPRALGVVRRGRRSSSSRVR